MAEIAAGKGRAATPFMTAKGARAGAVWQSNRDGRRRRACAAEQGEGLARKDQDRRQPAGLRRAAAVQVGRASAVGRGLGARDQVRRLPHAAAHRGRQGDAADPQGPRLDAKVRRHRPGRRKLAGRDHRRRDRGARPEGAPDFAALQAAIVRGQDRRSGVLRLRPAVRRRRGPAAAAAAERKARLQELLLARRRHAPLRYVEHFDTGGDAVLRSACRMYARGHRLQAPRRAVPVRPQRDWTKAKCRAGHEVVIGGWTDDRRAIPLAAWSASTATTSSSMSAASAPASARRVSALLPKLKALEIDKSPFTGRAPRRRPPTSTGSGPSWSPRSSSPAGPRDGQVRQASFKGLARGQAGGGGRGGEPAPAADDAVAAPTRQARRRTRPVRRRR